MHVAGSTTAKLTKAEKAGHRRAAVLAQFNGLVARGASKADAAKAVRCSIATLWRYQQRVNEGGRAALASQTYRSGRNSVAEELPISSAIIEELQSLAFVTGSATAAWRKFIEQHNCPAEIAECVRPLKTIPRSLVNLARLEKTLVVQFKGSKFSALVPARKAAA